MSGAYHVPAPDPPDERLRQAAIFASGVLAMRANPILRGIVARAAALLDTPIAAISIVDRDRQWFPAVVGLAVEETSRGVSFCAHAILTPGQTMCVCDASNDPRFAQNSLVTGEPRIRFYIGAPLVTSGGASIGALCAIDGAPRPQPTPAQDAELLLLARQAVHEIEQLDNIRRFGIEAIEFIVGQIRDAAAADDEPTLLALDRVLRSVEQKLRTSR